MSKGTWYITSKKDSRWNAKGYGVLNIFGSKDCDQKIRELEELYGDPPDDMTSGWSVE